MTSLFAYPSQASVQGAVPKSRVYRFGLAAERLQGRFVQQVEEIVWAYKLAPETVNLPPAGGVSEIQVFHVVLRGAALDDAVLATIDRAVNFPILFELVAADGMSVQAAAAYKRHSEANPERHVIGDYLYGQWLPADAERAPLPFALDLGGLYAALLRPLIPLPPRPGEGLRAQLDRLDQMRTKEREVRHAEARLHRERQFNRKVSLNAELRRLRAELARLSDPAMATGHRPRGPTAGPEGQCVIPGGAGHALAARPLHIYSPRAACAAPPRSGNSTHRLFAMDKLKLHTPDFTDANIARIAELFPGCVTEARGNDGRINLDSAVGPRRTRRSRRKSRRCAVYRLHPLGEAGSRASHVHSSVFLRFSSCFFVFLRGLRGELIFPGSSAPSTSTCCAKSSRTMSSTAPASATSSTGLASARPCWRPMRPLPRPCGPAGTRAWT